MTYKGPCMTVYHPYTVIQGPLYLHTRLVVVFARRRAVGMCRRRYRLRLHRLRHHRHRLHHRHLTIKNTAIATVQQYSSPNSSARTTKIVYGVDNQDYIGEYDQLYIEFRFESTGR